MKIICCCDDDMGMMFNNRRQSRDIAVYKRILDITKGHKLYMNSYSAKLFEGSTDIILSDSLIDSEDNSFCFVEDNSFLSYEEKISKIIIYRWNRKYPSDVKFTLSLEPYNLISSFDFAGNSHDLITEEVYERKI